MPSVAYTVHVQVPALVWLAQMVSDKDAEDVLCCVPDEFDHVKE
jgi:hypothetical protein